MKTNAILGNKPLQPNEILQPREVSFLKEATITKANYGLRRKHCDGISYATDDFLKDLISGIDHFAQEDGLSPVRVSIAVTPRPKNGSAAIKGILVWTGVKSVLVDMITSYSHIEIAGTPYFLVNSDAVSIFFDAVLQEIEAALSAATFREKVLRWRAETGIETGAQRGNR